MTRVWRRQGTICGCLLLAAQASEFKNDVCEGNSAYVYGVGVDANVNAFELAPFGILLGFRCVRRIATTLRREHALDAHGLIIHFNESNKFS